MAIHLHLPENACKMCRVPEFSNAGNDICETCEALFSDADFRREVLGVDVDPSGVPYQRGDAK